MSKKSIRDRRESVSYNVGFSFGAFYTLFLLGLATGVVHYLDLSWYLIPSVAVGIVLYDIGQWIYKYRRGDLSSGQ